MKEGPILFSAHMVRALLKGSKTQTRRAMKPQPVVPEGASIKLYDQTAVHMSRTRGWQVERPGAYDGAEVLGHLTEDRRQLNIGKMPYCVGDMLWVRETWAEHPDHPRRAVYRADPECKYDVTRWTPAIHMFRWASRIELEITAVRVERLQDISEADARAEGIVAQHGGGWGLPAGEHFHMTDPRISYWSLWETINGPGSVETNPWVWAVSFRKVAP